MKFQKEEKKEEEIEIDDFDVDFYNEEKWDTRFIINLRFKKPPTERLITNIINNLSFYDFLPINIIMTCPDCGEKAPILEHLTDKEF